MTLPNPAAEPPADQPPAPAAEAPAPVPETPAPAPEAPTQQVFAPAASENPAPAPSQLPPTMTPPPAAAPPQYAPPVPTGPIPVQSVPTGPMLVPPPLPRKPSKAGTVVLAIALAVVAAVAGAFAYVYTQASEEAEANAAELERLVDVHEELKTENNELVSDLAGLQLTADDFEACQTAFDAYNSFEFEGEINADAESFEELFTDEYIEYQNQSAELYQDVIVKCSP
ncbi:hypothetical protein AB0A73_00740 [Glycomyces sp. NPDC047369]